MWLFLILSVIALAVGVPVWLSGLPKEDYWGEKKRPKNPKRIKVGIILSILGLICLGPFLYLSRPWGHWFWFNLLYMAPTFWIGLGVTFIISAGIIWAWGRKHTQVGVGVGAFLIVVLFIVTAIFARPITMTKIYKNISETVSHIEEVPQTTNIRYLPMEVARYYGENKMQESEIRLGDFDPVYYEDEFVWVAPREQDGFIRRFNYQTDGAAFIHSDGSLTSIKQPMTYGEGMRITDNILWKLKEGKYFVDYCEIYYQLDGDTLVAVAPYIGFKYKFPVMVPYWAGVAVAYPDGEIIHYKPEEAIELAFDRVFPEKLARLYAESWAYKDGLVNKWFTHKDQVEVPNIAYSDNEMPYLLPTTTGLKWVTTTEPHGTSYGIFKVFVTDAVNGHTELWEAAKEAELALIGPNRAWEYAKAAFPMYDWYTGGASATGNIKLLEPRPINTDKFYWMMTVTTKEHAFAPNRPSTLLVDAKTTEVTSCNSMAEVLDVIEGRVRVEAEPIDDEAQPTADTQQIINQIKDLIRELEESIKSE